MTQTVFCWIWTNLRDIQADAARVILGPEVLSDVLFPAKDRLTKDADGTKQ